jgi:hypothetical protein
MAPVGRRWGVVHCGSSVSSRSAVAVLVTALVLGAAPTTAEARAPTQGRAQEKAPAASDTDLDFVRRVHLTALSISPAGALAREVSAHAAVKNLAAQISRQTAQLDTLARSTAAALKLSLTNPLPAVQQAALAALQSHTGAVFETQFVNYLWAADSALLPIAMTVHSTTRNTAVRKLAERADTVVATQLPLLQKSGLLQMAVLPTPAATAAARLPGGVPQNQGLEAQARSGDGFLSPALGISLIVLVAALVVAGVLIRRLVTRSGPPGRRRSRRHGRPGAGETAEPKAGRHSPLRTR